jgi:hypothetical protein
MQTSTSPIASQILRALAVRLQHNHTGLLAIDHISGIYNIMADVASRKHVSDPTRFLQYFTSTFPPPQTNFKKKMDHEPSPLVTTQGKYTKKISQLLESYRREDPPSKPKLVVPLSVPNYLVLAGLTSNDPKRRAVGNMATIAFHYLLRSGEYTFVNPKPPCPVNALIRQVKKILQYTTDTSTIISTFFSQRYPQGRALQVGCITRALQTAVRHLRLDRRGIRPSDVSSHSLRAGGATAMHLNNIPDRTIQKMGRWSSDTFLIYIHEQIAAFSRGVSKQMGLKVNFKNICRCFEPINSPELHTTPGLAQN